MDAVGLLVASIRVMQVRGFGVIRCHNSTASKVHSRIVEAEVGTIFVNVEVGP